MRVTAAYIGMILAAVTFAMLTNPTREGGFMPGALVAPEDRPAPDDPPLSAARAEASGLRLSPGPPPRRPLTDRDYWRWYGQTHVGDRLVIP